MKVALILAVVAAVVVAEESVKHGSSKEDMTRINNMLASVDRISKQFHNAPKSIAAKANSNIGKIREDFERIKKADDKTRKDLIEAVHLRLQALKETKQEMVDLEKDTKPASKPVSKAVSKTGVTLRNAARQDLEKIEASLVGSKYESDHLKQINSNIAGMKKDLNEMETATKERKGRLMEALKLRMTALKQQMAPEEHKESAVEKSEHDLEAVKADVAQAQGSPVLKTQINANIATMKEDLHNLEKASTERHGRLVEALKLRMKALKQQVQRLHQGDQSVAAKAAEANDLEAEAHHPALSKVASIESNMDAMTKDLHKLHDPKVGHNMREALKLRLKALNEQMKDI